MLVTVMKVGHVRMCVHHCGVLVPMGVTDPGTGRAVSVNMDMMSVGGCWWTPQLTLGPPAASGHVHQASNLDAFCYSA